MWAFRFAVQIAIQLICSINQNLKYTLNVIIYEAFVVTVANTFTTGILRCIAFFCQLTVELFYQRHVSACILDEWWAYTGQLIYTQTNKQTNTLNYVNAIAINNCRLVFFYFICLFLYSCELLEFTPSSPFFFFTHGSKSATISWHIGN